MGEIQAQNQKNYLFNAKKTAIRKSNHRVIHFLNFAQLKANLKFLIQQAHATSLCIGTNYVVLADFLSK